MDSQNRKSWVYNNWRPWSGLIYLVINVFDFILFPICSWYWAYLSDTPHQVWVPLTLQGAGMFHLAFGALLTATSWSKSKEKINGFISEPDK